MLRPLTPPASLLLPTRTGTRPPKRARPALDATASLSVRPTNRRLALRSPPRLSPAPSPSTVSSLRLPPKLPTVVPFPTPTLAPTPPHPSLPSPPAENSSRPSRPSPTPTTAPLSPFLFHSSRPSRSLALSPLPSPSPSTSRSFPPSTRCERACVAPLSSLSMAYFPRREKTIQAGGARRCSSPWCRRLRG